MREHEAVAAVEDWGGFVVDGAAGAEEGGRQVVRAVLRGPPVRLARYEGECVDFVTELAWEPEEEIV